MRKMLEEQGLALNGDNLVKILPKDEYQKLFASYRRAMDPQVKNDYKSNCASDAERRAWLAHYVLDPASAVHKGYNRVEVHESEQKKVQGQWLHEAQIAGPNYLNCKELTKLILPELTPRLSQFKALAEKGLQQYYFSMEMMESTIGKAQTAGVYSEGDMAADQAVAVRDSMLAAEVTEKAAPKRKATPRAAPESPSKKLRRDAVSLRLQMSKKLKAVIDKSVNDALTYEKDIAKLTEKGYPPEMQSWCASKLEPLREDTATAQAVYNEELVKTIHPSTPLREIEDATERLEKKHIVLDKAAKDWQKTAGAEIRKFTG